MRSTMGLYCPGESVLHRLPAGAKLLALICFGCLSVLIQRSWLATTIAVVVVVATYFLAGFGLRVLWTQVKPMLFLLVFMAVFHVWTAGWKQAYVLTSMLLCVVAAAALVTLTTRTTQLIDAVVRVVRPLKRVGIDPERVGLMITLGIRVVPLVAELAAKVREAQIARSQQTTFKAFAVPLIVSALRRADAMGEALVARGVDD